jgi:hypothetical protein
MRTIAATLALSVVSVAALSGCAAQFAGSTTSQERPISAVTSVALEAAGDLVIREGDPKLVVSAGSRVIDLLTSEVSGDELVLGLRDGRLPFGIGRVRYELWLPSLESVRIDGSGDIDGELPVGDLAIEISGAGDAEFGDVSADVVTVDVDGAGDVTLAGTASEVSVRVDGTGDLDAEDLQAQDVTVEVEGTGDVHVWATETLDVQVSGIGDVRYDGDPEITQHISGIGEVRAD